MRRISTFFMSLGVVIGVVGSIGLAVGFQPSQLPPELLDIAAYKLTFIAAACVLAGGAVIRRAERRRHDRDAAASSSAAELGASARFDDGIALQSRRERARERR